MARNAPAVPPLAVVLDADHQFRVGQIQERSESPRPDRVLTNRLRKPGPNQEPAELDLGGTPGGPAGILPGPEQRPKSATADASRTTQRVDSGKDLVASRQLPTQCIFERELERVGFQHTREVDERASDGRDSDPILDGAVEARELPGSVNDHGIMLKTSRRLDRYLETRRAHPVEPPQNPGRTKGEHRPTSTPERGGKHSLSAGRRRARYPVDARQQPLPTPSRDSRLHLGRGEPRLNRLRACHQPSLPGGNRGHAAFRVIPGRLILPHVTQNRGWIRQECRTPVNGRPAPDAHSCHR